MRSYIYITVFISGLSSLALEMAASRLLGNVFGTSNLIWAVIIGLILIYLAVGNFIGGKWADRSPHPRTFYSILMWAALASALAVVIARPVLRLAAGAFDQLQIGLLIGSFTAVFILLIVPVTLLGTASPFAIRLAIRDQASAGSVSGRIYAISTLGSFIGTFLPVLVLIPTIGTYRTFLTISLLLMAVALPGLWFSAGRRVALPYVLMPLTVAGLFIYGLPGTDKITAGLIYETESSYNYIQVLEQDGFHYLRLNEGQGVHSVYHPTELNYFGPWEQVLAAPFFNPAPFDPADFTSMAIVGLAAGTTARQVTETFGPVAIDGIEIDPKIVNAGRQYFGMEMSNLNVIVQDGRYALAHSDKRYQVISVDAYRPPYIPWHMTTREFFQTARSKMTDDGVLVINVGRSPTDRRLVDALTTTLLHVFSSAYVVDVPNSFNTIVYATVQPTDINNLYQNYNTLSQQEDAHPLLLYALQIAITNLQPTPEMTQVFTDDLAPVEWITNDLILDYLFFSPAQELQ